ncbi:MULTISPECIES: hypothetical protein [unclassified Bosea (in: a-proteobacteria)]|uniref:hypothetical protein n=1 Tax=unclassified Bosea (in: a-proteobacteria) TaxID=2653178 RepID=UPI000F760033|nr:MULTISPECIES: hypothetical protein [unclassified Bosea (in: a-proteobacteria)]AZO82125.1 hypothetical protein BLM15_30555 [Bosea sp. Tri-49]RXT15570.1 hypothetical protein B5U98_31105 [Bosea sp. Tri-39]RXT34451.1 hypothetical protein B5U99_18100 [Bosea sp. Tri-54]
MSLNGTILKLAHHYTEPAELLKAVRKKHPEASKKDIIHAALRTMIEAAESKEGVAAHLHRLVMDNRGGDF